MFVKKRWYLLVAGAFSGFLLAVVLQVGASSEEQLPIEEIRRLNHAFETIKKLYVDEKSSDNLMNAAIKGMISSLDPHSAYLEPKALTNLNVSAQGKFGGLGIEVVMENGFVKVVAPLDDTPADKSNIKAGDVIIKLDERSVKGMTLTEAVDIMRGEPGSDINLTIVREGENAPLVKKLTRAIIQLTSVRSRKLDDDILYVRISHFQEPTAREMIKKIEKSQKEGSVKGLILDLRNNPGGVLSGAVNVSGAFLDGSTVVSTIGRSGSSNEVLLASKGDVIPQIPIVVLINEGSASASEIVAGALQDHKRGMIVGRKSFGKGSVQTIINLSDNYGMKLTTARYYTPNGRSIQAEGIKPDIDIPLIKVTQLNENANRIQEKDLQGHLKSEGTTKTEKTAEPKKADEKTLITRDYELQQALNVIKTLTWNK